MPRKKTPPPEHFDQIAVAFTNGALDNIIKLYAKHSRLPLLTKDKAILQTVMFSLSRQSMSVTAELALTGTDVTLAVLPKDQPPSPI